MTAWMQGQALAKEQHCVGKGSAVCGVQCATSHVIAEQHSPPQVPSEEPQTGVAAIK
jgi:hypothetical protein